MRNYPSIRNLFESLFSVEVGLEDSSAQIIFEKILADDFQRGEIELELRQLFNDESISWVEFLDNRDYAVYPADDEEDAKAYVVRLLWNKVFPSEPVPQLVCAFGW